MQQNKREKELIAANNEQRIHAGVCFWLIVLERRFWVPPFCQEPEGRARKIIAFFP